MWCVHVAQFLTWFFLSWPFLSRLHWQVLHSVAVCHKSCCQHHSCQRNQIPGPGEGCSRHRDIGFAWQWRPSGISSESQNTFCTDWGHWQHPAHLATLQTCRTSGERQGWQHCSWPDAVHAKEEWSVQYTHSTFWTGMMKIFKTSSELKLRFLLCWCVCVCVRLCMHACMCVCVCVCEWLQGLLLSLYYKWVRNLFCPMPGYLRY